MHSEINATCNLSSIKKKKKSIWSSEKKISFCKELVIPLAQSVTYRECVDLYSVAVHKNI